MVAPAAWAIAAVGATALGSAVTTASAATVLANGKARILLLLEIVVAGVCPALQSTGIRDGAAGKHADQVGAILRAAVNVAGKTVRRNRQPFERFRRKPLLERRFEFWHPEHARRTGAGHRDPHFRRALGNEYADQRKARRRIAEFLIRRLLRRGEAHLGDDLFRGERGFKQTSEEFVGTDFALGGESGGGGAKAGGGIFGIGVVVGDRTADRAAVAHRRIADHVGERRQRR